MQRTGGTSLTKLLMTLSEHKTTDHEPFNWEREPRQFARVARAWAETQNEEALFAALSEIFYRGYLIKHCYEFHAASFNVRLMKAAAQTNYRRIHLVRRNELSRLISKFIAQAHGTWFRDFSITVFAEVA